MQKDPQRIKISDREIFNKLDLSGINFPVSIDQIPLIEERFKIRINVFRYFKSIDGKKPGSTNPLHVSKEKYPDHMEVLYIVDGEKQHYVYMKNFNRFMHNFTKHRERKHFCMYCLKCFYSNRRLEKHKADCRVINGVQAIRLPSCQLKDGKWIKPSVSFENHHKQAPLPFAIYADFERNLEKVSGCTPSGKTSYTNQYQKHIPVSFGYKVVCHHD